MIRQTPIPNSLLVLVLSLIAFKLQCSRLSDIRPDSIVLHTYEVACVGRLPLCELSKRRSPRVDHGYVVVTVDTHSLDRSCIFLLLLGTHVGIELVDIFVDSLLAIILHDRRDPSSADRASVVLLQPLDSTAVLAEVVLAWELHDKLLVLELFPADHTVCIVLRLDFRVRFDGKRLDGSVRSRVQDRSVRRVGGLVPNLITAAVVSILLIIRDHVVEEVAPFTVD